MSNPPEDVLAKLQEALVKKAEVLLRCLKRAAENGVMETVEVVAPQLADLMQVREFPNARKSEFIEGSRACQLPAYKRSVEVLLFQAEHRVRDGDEKGRNEALAKAKQHFGRALRLGADDEFRATVEKRVKSCLLTSARGVDDKTKDAAARRLEARDRNTTTREGGERRRALRYSVPPLTVEIEGTNYDTANWSQLGLLVDGYAGKPPVKVGDKLKIGLGVAGSLAPEKQLARVVRVIPGKRQFAVEFPEISTIVLDLISAMKRMGFSPRAR